MLKNILNINDAQQLSKNEQKALSGGGRRDCSPNIQCPSQLTSDPDY